MMPEPGRKAFQELFVKLHRGKNIFCDTDCKVYFYYQLLYWCWSILSAISICGEVRSEFDQGHE